MMDQLVQSHETVNIQPCLVYYKQEIYLGREGKGEEREVNIVFNQQTSVGELT